MTQHGRNKMGVVLDNALTFIAGVFLGIVYAGVPWYTAPLPTQAFDGCPARISGHAQTCFVATGDQILNRGSMACIAVGLVSCASMIRVFGAERIVFWRESAALSQPVHTLAYFIGKDLSMVPQLLAGPLVFNLVFHALTAPRAAFSHFYLVFLGLYYCSMGFAYLVAAAVPPDLAQLTGVVAVFSNAMFAGGMPTLKQLLAKFAPLCWLPHISFMRYALEAFYVSEASQWQEIASLMDLSLPDFIKDTYGYQMNAFTKDILIMFLIGFVVRVMAFLALLLLHRDKKQ